MMRPSTTVTRGERLQKILSQAGVSSRRAAESLIRAGRVTLNGRKVTELGTRADPRRDRIAIDGRPLKAAESLTYIVLNKPVGVVTTLADPEGRPTVRDLLGGVRQRVFPVGRLDYHSAGLLVLTNDGELALRLTHPRYGVRKTYHVKVKGVPQAAQITALARGVSLPDGYTAPAAVRIIESNPRKAWLSIALAEGKNRQVRRMCEAVGLAVEKLERVAYGPLKLGKLPPGAWRFLEPEEVERLRWHSPEAAPRPAVVRRDRLRRRGAASVAATAELSAVPPQRWRDRAHSQTGAALRRERRGDGGARARDQRGAPRSQSRRRPR